MAIFGFPVYMLGLGRTSPSHPNETAVMDFNGDGHLDLFTAWFYVPLSQSSQTITIHLGNGDGTFRDGTTTVVPGTLPTTVHPRELVLRDFNGDGRTDVYIADHGYDMPPFPGYQDQLLLSTPRGTWRDGTSFLPQRSDFTHSATAADVDGDGDIDIYQGNLGPGPGPAILLNDGTGRFTIGQGALPASVATPNGVTTYTTSEFADFDRDGDADLFLGDFQAGSSVILLNDGSGKFAASSKALPAAPFGADSVLIDSQARDFNGDGRIDLMVVAHRSDGSGRGAQILINKGAGRFADETATRLDVDWSSDTWMRYVQFADLNGDGYDDLITELDGAPAEVLLNNGDGFFFEPPNNELQLPSSYELGDFDKDGKIDVINWGGGQLEFRPGTGTVPIRLNGTERINELFGDGFANRQDGRGGNDVIRSGAGNDDVTGGAGDDKLFGGSGRDILKGADGIDVLEGGRGSDLFVFSHVGAANADTIRDFRQGTDRIVLDAPRFEGGLFADITYTATGKLYFDGVLVATLVGAPPLTASDVVFG